jgi:hypothetical protein
MVKLLLLLTRLVSGSPLAQGTFHLRSNLTPEFTRELEISTEMRFFKKTGGFELTYYNKKSTDLIYAIIYL